MTKATATDNRVYEPPRLNVLGSVQVLTQSQKTLGLGDGLIFWHTSGGRGGVGHTS